VASWLVLACLVLARTIIFKVNGGVLGALLAILVPCFKDILPLGKILELEATMTQREWMLINRLEVSQSLESLWP
jgi:hypothetical protein